MTATPPSCARRVLAPCSPPQVAGIAATFLETSGDDYITNLAAFLNGERRRLATVSEADITLTVTEGQYPYFEVEVRPQRLTAPWLLTWRTGS